MSISLLSTLMTEAESAVRAPLFAFSRRGPCVPSRSALGVAPPGDAHRARGSL